MSAFLSNSGLHALPPGVMRPPYDRSRVQAGIVHFGPGAFHRAHQAWYVERLLAEDPRWGICAVSLRNPDVRDALLPQDYLYTLAIRDETPGFQIIGAINEVLVAPENPSLVLRRLSAPTTHVVTVTVTEKGYCLGADGELDLAHPDIRRDLQNPRVPTSVVGFIAEGLRLRRVAGLRPFTVISCDNLADNGARLARATARFAGDSSGDFARWIESEVSFPRTMVDSITPATTTKLKGSVLETLGVEDRWPVEREAFVQWVIEETQSDHSPDWSRVGVTLTNDVGGYERAKLRLLNGAHSTLAYVGLLRGYTTVGEAMRDEELRAFIKRMMTEDIRPTLNAPGSLDLSAYIEAILKRFCNPSMHHALAQIAMDGSQKLPIRILGTIQDALAAGRSIDRLCVPIAAWMRFVRRAALSGERVSDPLAESLLKVGKSCQGYGDIDTPRFLELSSMFPPDLRSDERFRNALSRAYDHWDTSRCGLPEV